MKCNEIKIQVIRECNTEYPISTARGIAEFWNSEIIKSAWYDHEKEAFAVIFLSQRHHIKGYNLVSLGIQSSCLTHAREVFRPAIISGAAAVIVAHNHPGGDTTPSQQDVRVTKDLVAASKIIDIPLLDHVIISGLPDGKYTSLRETCAVNFDA